MVTGTNEDDFHLRHVDVDRDLSFAHLADLRSAEPGDRCVQCQAPIDIRKSIEVGHIFKLGLRYSEAMGATVLDAEGNEIPIVMGSYGIGIERIMAAAIEAHHDENGVCWPASIAPFDVIVTAVKAKSPEQTEAAERIRDELEAAGFEVLLDDRNERPGVKFKDADLIGIPFRVVLGPRAMAKGNVELVERASAQTEEVPAAALISELERRRK